MTKAEELRALAWEVERTRKRFLDAFKAYEATGNEYLDRAPHLPSALFKSARMYGHRDEMLFDLPTGGNVAEVGTDQAIFSRKILEVCRPTELHLFDIEPQRIIESNIAEARTAGIVKVHAGDSAELLARFPDDHFDWIYIDADHSLEGVSRDLEVARRKVKPGGLLVFNDYTTWSLASMRRCGVARAVNLFLAENPWPVKHFALQQLMYCDLSIERPRVNVA